MQVLTTTDGERFLKVTRGDGAEEFIDGQGEHYVAKAKRPAGHTPGCACPVCQKVDESKSEFQQVHTQMTGKDDMDADAIAKSLAEFGRDPTLDPTLRAQAGQAATRYTLAQLNRARALKAAGFDMASSGVVAMMEGLRQQEDNAVECQPGLPSGLPHETTMDRENRQLHEFIEQQKKPNPSLIAQPANPRAQLEAVRDGATAQQPYGGAPLVPTPSLDYREAAKSASLQTLEKAVAEAPTEIARQCANEALTLGRLRVLNEARRGRGQR